MNIPENATNVLENATSFDHHSHSKKSEAFSADFQFFLVRIFFHPAKRFELQNLSKGMNVLFPFHCDV
jgi:hypothetical protein